MKYIWTKHLPFLTCFFTTTQQIAIIVISAITKTPPTAAATIMIMEKGFLDSRILDETVGETVSENIDMDELMNKSIISVE